MKILFVENRQQTLFWKEIAACLAEDGHEIHWLVQNHRFSPRLDNVHRIPYPSTSFLEDREWPPDVQKVIDSDRNVNYFGGTSRHYAYYNEQIGNRLSRIEPDVVFGESTLFHELLTARHCLKRDILYLQPTSCRYPVGRFSFFLYDTLDVFSGSGDDLPPHLAKEMAREIGGREIQPDYMKRSSPTIRQMWTSMMGRLQLLGSFVAGERYNTPSPLVKMRLQSGLENSKQRWEALAREPRNRVHAYQVLYPLQMQPESTIDVWGHPNLNQVKLLQAFAQGIREDVGILVKPNPKSYYEMSTELVEFVRSTPQLVPISHNVSMGSLLPETDLIVTVTGTIAIEAVCAGKPVVTLKHTINNLAGGCLYLQDPFNLGTFVQQIRCGARIPESCGIKLLQALHQNSFPGLISNPHTTPDCILPANLTLVHQAFRKVLREVRTRQTLERPAPCTSAYIGATDATFRVD